MRAEEHLQTMTVPDNFKPWVKSYKSLLFPCSTLLLASKSSNTGFCRRCGPFLRSTPSSAAYLLCSASQPSA